MLMFCKYCGKELREGAKFCSSCGGNISAKKTAKPIVKTKRKGENIFVLKRNLKPWHVLGIVAVLLIMAYVFIGNGGSIEGKWYIVFEESYENPPESEFNFMENGTFIGDGNVGGTYGAENGDSLQIVGSFKVKESE